MQTISDAMIERLQNIIEASSPEDFEWWDKDTLLEENKSPEELKIARMDKLNQEGIARPLHKHNIEVYEKQD